MSNNRYKALAGYAEVASPIVKPETPDNKEVVGPAVDQQEVPNKAAASETDKPLKIDDIVNAIIETPKQPKKKQVNFYIDEDVIKELEKFNKKHGKGAKSNLVNEFLRKVFKL